MPRVSGGLDLLTPAVVARLRRCLADAGFRYDEVADLLGATAHTALSRNETTAGLRATRGGSPLETLVRLWPLQTTVSRPAADRALPGLVEPLEVAGMLACSGGEVRARVDLRPYADDGHDWWVVSDLTPGLDGAPIDVADDHVLGISPAAMALTQLTVREPARRALDLGTGCGVQALHLADHTETVVATDVNERALAMTRLNATLNEVAIDVRAGSLFEPVADERFDLVVTNPPFVVSPGREQEGDRRLVYRDSGLPGDELVRLVVTTAPRHLEPGGWAQVVANWAHHADQPWQDRVTGWLQDSGCDAWVVQRDVADPAEYVELWLKDAGVHGRPDYVKRYDEWLAWFDEQRIEAVGFGWLHMRRTDHLGRDPVLHLEEWPYEVEQPLGREVAERARRVDRVAAADDQTLLASCFTRRVDVRQETMGEPGAGDPERIVLRQQRGMRRARQCDTVEAALVGACDGDLTVGQILDALATLLDRDAAELRLERVAAVRDLVTDGFLTPPG